MLASAALGIEHSLEPEESHRLDVQGELDAETAPHLISGLRGAVRAGTRLRLDLSGVTFIDCSGLNALLSALEDVRSSGCAVEVLHEVSPPVRRIIQLTRTRNHIWP
ncbi:MAG TPA: STAS domain-containing protein [Solirubrobacteraceae bacterium]|jgi:anti-anti-sigma factor|nr:STAS domain-containing protein [Solirubrobacteraceae bacterium]